MVSVAFTGTAFIRILIQEIKSMNTRSTFTTLLCCLALVAGISSTRAEESSAKPQEAEAYVHELKVEKKTFEDKLVQEVKPRLDAIRETFRESLLEMEGNLLALRRDPNDEARKEAYEQSLNKALADSQQVLQAFSEVEPQAMKAFGQFAGSLETAIEKSGEGLAQAKQDQREYAERKVRLTAALEKLAQQHETVLTSTSTSLDPELALDVRLMAADLDIATQYETLSQVDLEYSKTLLEELKQQKAELTQLKQNFAVNVHKADGMQLVLGKISEIKAKGESIRKLNLRLQTLANAMPSIGKDLAKMDGLFHTFVNHDPILQPSGRKQTVKSQVTAGNEIEILKRFLPQSKELANANATP